MNVGVAEANKSHNLTPRGIGEIRRRIFAVLAAAYAIGAVAYIVWRMIEYRMPYPFWDGVDIDLFVGERFLPDWHLHTAFHFIHNEHRPVFPLHIWAMDHAWFASEGLSVIVFDAILLLLVALLLARWLRGSGSLTLRRIVLVAAAPIAVFWPAQWQNLNWSVQVNFILATAALVAATHFILIAERGGREGRRSAYVWLLLSAVCVFVSSFSLAFGLLGWPILLAYLLCRGVSWRLSAPFALAGAGAIWQYAATWAPILIHADPFAALLQPISVGTMALSVLGAPLHHLLDNPFIHPPAWLRLVSGGAIFLAIAWPGCRIFFERRSAMAIQSSFGDRALILVALLAVACAFIIALGRHTFGPEQALTSRYVLFSALAWLGAIGYWLPRLPATRAVKAAGFAAIPLLAIVVAGSYLFQIAEMRIFTSIIRVAAAAATHDIDDPKMEPRIYSADVQSDKLTRLAASLRKRGHQFLAEPWQAWYGRNAVEIFGPADRTRCAGYSDSSLRFGSSVLRLSGWVWDGHRKAPPPYVIGVDDAGIVRGVGFTGLRRTDLIRFFGQLGFFNAGWMLLADTDAAQLSVFAITHDGRLCALMPLSPPDPQPAQ